MNFIMYSFCRRTRVFSLRSQAPINFEFQLTFVESHSAFSVDPLAGMDKWRCCLVIKQLCKVIWQKAASPSWHPWIHAILTPIKYMVPWIHVSQAQTGSVQPFLQSSRVCSADRRTDHTMCDICTCVVIGHVRGMHAMRPKNVQNL